MTRKLKQHLILQKRHRPTLMQSKTGACSVYAHGPAHHLSTLAKEASRHTEGFRTRRPRPRPAVEEVDGDTEASGCWMSPKM